MKILSSQDIYNADLATLKAQNISSLQLMERAALTCSHWIHRTFQKNSQKVLVFCGVGNNGGDGLVIARHLIEHGYEIQCYIVRFSKKQSPEFKANYDRLVKTGVSPIEIDKETAFPEIEKVSLVVDAIFGIGLKRPSEGFTAKLIDHINKSKAFILAIDIPSGLFADRTNLKDDRIIKSFPYPNFSAAQISFLLPDNQNYIDSWEVVDIGLDQEFIDSVLSPYQIIQPELVKSIYKPRAKFSHKGTFGHALLIGGSYGKIGAVSLASKAALKSGSGLVTAYVPKCGYEILQVSLPEAMVEVDGEKELSFFNYRSKPTAIGIGPGMGTAEKTVQGFSKFLKENTLPLVVDADALNILAKNKELLKNLPKGSILTPHPKELERLIGRWKNDYEKLQFLEKFCLEYAVILVVKGAHTLIVDGKQFYFNSTGNPALATAGSGDVLAGIITGLLAQKYPSIHAAILGVYVHGLSADIGLRIESKESFIASDIVDSLGEAFKKLSENRSKKNPE